MRVRLNGPFADLELGLPAEVSALDQGALELRDADEVRERLRAALAIRPALAQLRALLLALGDPLPTQDEPALLDRVARLVARGALELRTIPHEIMASDAVELFEDLSERSMAPAPAPVVEATHWIEYALQRPDGTPMAGVRCEIELPWGVTVTRTSDQYGIIRLDYLPEAGDALIRLPSLDEAPPPDDEPDDELELVEVYSVQELGVGEGEPPTGPPPEDEPPRAPTDDWALVAHSDVQEQPEVGPPEVEPPEDPSDEWDLVDTSSDHVLPELTPTPRGTSTTGSTTTEDPSGDEWDLVGTNSDHELPELTPTPRD